MSSTRRHWLSALALLSLAAVAWADDTSLDTTPINKTVQRRTAESSAQLLQSQAQQRASTTTTAPKAVLVKPLPAQLSPVGLRRRPTSWWSRLFSSN